MGKANTKLMVCVIALLLSGCAPSRVLDRSSAEDTGAADPPSGSPAASTPAAPLATGSVKHRVQRVSLGDKSYRVSLVSVPLGSTRVKVGLAHRRIGRSERLSDIARRYGAVAAINGCFFDAYSGRSVRNPHHTLIVAGEVVHRGDVGSILGVASDGRADISRMALRIVGSLDGHEAWPDSWYAYWINRYPEAETTATIYTRHWAESTTPDGGIQIVVREGVVTEIGAGSQLIPHDGFVLYLRGQEEYLAGRFSVGRRCDYRVVQQVAANSDIWTQVREALGCGPTLVQAGGVAVDPESEGFSHPKILTMACNRSAAGLTPDGHLLMVACSEATITELAEIMMRLGCSQAMNLDGGASSGLWCRGEYLVEPGRPVSNAVLALPGR